VLQDQPDHGGAAYVLGKVDFIEKHYASAVERLQQAVRFDPKFLSAYYLLGQAYLKVGEQQRSQEAFARFRELTEEERAARLTAKKKIVVSNP